MLNFCFIPVKKADIIAKELVRPLDACASPRRYASPRNATQRGDMLHRVEFASQPAVRFLRNATRNADARDVSSFGVAPADRRQRRRRKKRRGRGERAARLLGILAKKARSGHSRAQPNVAGDRPTDRTNIVFLRAFAPHFTPRHTCTRRQRRERLLGSRVRSGGWLRLAAAPPRRRRRRLRLRLRLLRPAYWVRATPLRPTGNFSKDVSRALQKACSLSGRWDEIGDMDE